MPTSVPGVRRILDRVRALAVLTEAEAERATRALTSVLLEQLPPHERGRIERVLPPQWLGSASIQAPTLVTPDLHDFYERVAHREGCRLGPAIEHAQCVCRALVEALSDDERRSLVHHLPEALGVLFALPEPSLPPAHRPPSGPAHPRTVAEGHTGSDRPLSESAPERAQTHSVAKNPNPHADTKVSSSQGPTQEREGETLASGKPAGRPVSES